MKKYFRIGSLFLLVFLATFLVGCNSFNGIKKNFEDAGYTYSEDVNTTIKSLLTEFEKEDVVVTPHVFTKSFNIAVVLEFKSTKEMNQQIEESETLKGLLKDLQKSDFVKGNCVLIPIGINQEDMVKVFQGR